MSTMYDAETKNRTIERLTKLVPDKKPLWGKMNVVEMLTHVNDGFRTPLRDRTPTPIGNFIMHTLGKFMILNMKIPKGAPTHPETNPHIKGTKPETFELEKQKLIALIDRFQDAKESSLAENHPVIGKMTHEKWGILMAKHVDHHFRQFGV